MQHFCERVHKWEDALAERLRDLGEAAHVGEHEHGVHAASRDRVEVEGGVDARRAEVGRDDWAPRLAESQLNEAQQPVHAPLHRRRLLQSLGSDRRGRDALRWRDVAATHATRCGDDRVDARPPALDVSSARRRRRVPVQRGGDRANRNDDVPLRASQQHVSTHN